MAAATASFTPVEVMVAPETPSMSALWAERTCFSSSAKALPPISGVSLSPVSFTAAILPSATVISATMASAPPKPAPLPVKVSPPTMGAAGVSTGAGVGVGTLSPLAWAMQLATASFTALEVRVAPETPSNSALWAVMAASARTGMAAPPYSGVSLSPVMSTALITASVKVALTVTPSGPKPWAVAVYVPAV